MINIDWVHSLCTKSCMLQMQPPVGAVCESACLHVRVGACVHVGHHTYNTISYDTHESISWMCNNIICGFGI